MAIQASSSAANRTGGRRQKFRVQKWVSSTQGLKDGASNKTFGNFGNTALTYILHKSNIFQNVNCACFLFILHIYPFCFTWLLRWKNQSLLWVLHIAFPLSSLNYLML
jgi:hypothetical protein